jgi:hypothetical protein
MTTDKMCSCQLTYAASCTLLVGSKESKFSMYGLRLSPSVLVGMLTLY